MNTVSQSVIDSITVDGVVDYATLKEIVADLSSVKKSLSEEAKIAEKATRALNREVLAKVGKEYYDGLSVGDVFKITNSKGEVIELTKIATKSNSGLSAAGELVNPPADSKTAKRYPKFYQIVVPSEE